jgi:DNA-binding NarL/FixJ family response regulator
MLGILRARGAELARLGRLSVWPPGMTTRVVAVADHLSLSDTLRTLLRDADHVTVVAHCAPGRGAPPAIADRQADAIVLDLHHPVSDGLVLLGVIAEQRRRVRVVVLGATARASDVLEAIGIGAAAGPLHEGKGEHGNDGSVDVDMPGVGLTARELEIVRGIAGGLRNRAIAEKLRVTEGTVKVHLHNIYKKLGLGGRLALMVYTRKHGLV